MQAMPKGTILVTGGSRGIGAQTVRLAAQAGHAVCFTYQSRAETAQSLVRELTQAGARVHAVQAEVRDGAGAAALLQQVPSDFPPLVGLVNNVGITGPLGPFDKLSEATLRDVFEVNVVGAMLLAQQVLQRWQAAPAPGRSIVNVSSIAATLGAPGEYVHYAASKAALEAFTVGLAKEVAPQGVRVNCVSPGTTLTEIHATAGEPGRPQRVAARIPMGRAGEAEEIAQAIVWLLSPQASYATGSVLKVAGGL
ncbi:SDR family oxidoreductase [Xenophilus arseniciresistens]|uniref:SDR family oxidoreductase n=1 Tax=Xenophilus arseniciresistens TaxID=1283306 RepID=A0AAE3NA28_9BURK|nr:SDR family oxidoreductase [Xenophilus arseniciresistens]MDA7417578.1 SDR family oxidoreductase [Xenophilus arseniciresistens]